MLTAVGRSGMKYVGSFKGSRGGSMHRLGSSEGRFHERQNSLGRMKLSLRVRDWVRDWGHSSLLTAIVWGWCLFACMDGLKAQQPSGGGKSPFPPRAAQSVRVPERLPQPSEAAKPVDTTSSSAAAHPPKEQPPLPLTGRAPQVARKPLPSIAAEATAEATASAPAPAIDLGLPTASLQLQPAAQERLPTAQQQLPPAQERLPVLPVKANQTSTSLRGQLPISMRSPRIEVRLEGPNDVALGQRQQYRLKVKNEDTISVHGLVLRLVVPEGVDAHGHNVSQGKVQVDQISGAETRLTWAFQDLASGELATMAIELTARTISSFNLATEWTLQPISEQTTVQVRAPQIQLALSGPEQVEFGRPCTYQLQISNPGNADAVDVQLSLSAEQFGESSTPIGVVRAGSTEEIEVELVFNERGDIRILASAVATGGLQTTSEMQVQVRRAELEMVVDVPESVYHGAATQCFFRVSNTGDLAARQATARVKIPASATAVDLPEAVVRDGQDLVWFLGDLEAGSIEELSFYVEFRGDGNETITAQCSSDHSAVVRQNVTTNVVGFVDMKLAVAVPEAPAPVGSEVQYVLELSNRGSKVAEDINVVALFSKDIEPTRAEGKKAEIIPGQVRFAPIERLLPGESILLKVFAQAEAEGLHRFRAEVNTPNAEVKLVQEETTQYVQTLRRSAISGTKPILR